MIGHLIQSLKSSKILLIKIENIWTRRFNYLTNVMHSKTLLNPQESNLYLNAVNRNKYCLGAINRDKKSFDSSLIEAETTLIGDVSFYFFFPTTGIKRLRHFISYINLYIVSVLSPQSGILLFQCFNLKSWLFLEGFFFCIVVL
jgi:hypothetical protein